MNNSHVVKKPRGGGERATDWVAALTIAGSDSCGGAGVQADLKTFNRFGVFGASALTALTAQNTRAVERAMALSPDWVAGQIEACFEDLPIAAAKTGMLANAGIIEAVVETLDEHAPDIPLVVDPVIVATSGARLLDADALGVLTGRLLPKACLITPNLPEARALTGLGEAAADEELIERLLGEFGCRAVLLKGGHGGGETSIDWLVAAGLRRRFSWPRIGGKFHGTGCCLSAAITAGLARGSGLEEAVEAAGAWLNRLIRHAHRPLAGDLGLLPFEDEAAE